MSKTMVCQSNILHKIIIMFHGSSCGIGMHMVLATDINIYHQFGYAVPLQTGNKFGA